MKDLEAQQEEALEQVDAQEKRVHTLIQTIIENYASNVDNLLISLNQAKMMRELYDVAMETVDSCITSSLKLKDMGQMNSDSLQGAIQKTQDSMLQIMDDVQKGIQELLDALKRIRNDADDIEDDEKYQRIMEQNRQERKRLYKLKNFCEECRSKISGYVPVAELDSLLDFANTKSEKAEPSVTEAADADSMSETAASATIADAPVLKSHLEVLTTEQKFQKWLEEQEHFSGKIAKQYITDMHSIENLYSKTFGIRKPILNAATKEDAKAVIEELVNTSAYIDANQRRQNSFQDTLQKYAQFAGFSIAEPEPPEPKQKIVEKPRMDMAENLEKLTFSQKSSEIVRLDFQDPQIAERCTFCKPVSITVGGTKHLANSWVGVYSIFLFFIYRKNNGNILNEYINKPLYGITIDFANDSLMKQLRSPIRITSDFWAEGNLSAKGIVNRMQFLRDLCSIDDSDLQIWYRRPIDLKETPATETEAVNTTAFPSMQEQLKEQLDSEKSLRISEPKQSVELESVPEEIPLTEQPSTRITEEPVISEPALPAEETAVSSESITNTPQQALEETAELTEPNPKPKKSEPFDLKKEIIAILLRDDEKAQKGRYKNGLTPKQIKDLLWEQEHKIIPVFKIIDLLKRDGSFFAVGKNCYALNTAMQKKKKMMDLPPIKPENSSIIVEPEHAQAAEEPSEKPTWKEPEQFVKNIISESTDSEGETEQGIAIQMHGRDVLAYDFAEAFCKICEFAIRYCPFRMARIAGQKITLNGKPIFYRRAVPVEGYRHLSNGLQVLPMQHRSDLEKATAAIREYCQIDDGEIIIKE